MKVLYTFDEAYGTFFVDENANLIHYIHENDGADAAFSEYIRPLFKYFGGYVRELKINLSQQFLEFEENGDDSDYEGFFELYQTDVFKAIQAQQTKKSKKSK